MRERKPHLIATFATTTDAMLAESLCRAAGVPGRLIPTPVSITAGCGLAWAMPPEAREQFDRAASGRVIPSAYTVLPL